MANFVPRLTKVGIWQNPLWYRDNPLYPEWQMPNCTCYAIGRFWELTGVHYNMPWGNAVTWWTDNKLSGFVHSQTPILGSIVVWGGGRTGAGHVAIVEEIYSNGDIRISCSGWWRNADGSLPSYPPDNPNYWVMYTITRSSGYWYDSSHYFLGFIHPPVYSGVPITDQYSWTSITEFQSSYWNDKSISNAYCVGAYFLGRGWTINAICGLLGNALHESYCSADMGEVGGGGGYGLLQWTPASKITDYLDQYHSGWRSDLDVQGYGECDRVIYEMNNNLQWFADPRAPQEFNIHTTMSSFSVANDTPETLAGCWLYWYEHSADPAGSLAARQHWAREFYNLFQYAPPSPTGKGKAASKWIMFLRNPYLYRRW